MNNILNYAQQKHLTIFLYLIAIILILFYKLNHKLQQVFITFFLKNLLFFYHDLVLIHHSISLFLFKHVNLILIFSHL